MVDRAPRCEITDSCPALWRQDAMVCGGYKGCSAIQLNSVGSVKATINLPNHGLPGPGVSLDEITLQGQVVLESE